MLKDQNIFSCTKIVAFLPDGERYAYSMNYTIRRSSINEYECTGIWTGPMYEITGTVTFGEEFTNPEKPFNIVLSTVLANTTTSKETKVNYMEVRDVVIEGADTILPNQAYSFFARSISPWNQDYPEQKFTTEKDKWAWL